MLDQHPVLEHRDLGAVAALPDDHGPVHRLAPGQELGLGQDRDATPARVPAIATALALSLPTLDRDYDKAWDGFEKGAK